MYKKTVMVYLLIVLLFVNACGSYVPQKKKADDELSKELEQSMGSDIYYMGRENSDSFGMSYKFLLRSAEPEIIATFSDILNKYIIGKKEKISIYVYCEVLNATETVFCIYNYTNKEKNEADIEDGVLLYIPENRQIEEDAFLDLMTYVVIKKVKYFSITSKMKEQIDGKVDLYHYWPDLEEIIVR